MTVERLNEQLRALQAFEQRLAVRDAEQGIAQLARHPVDDAARDQELAHLRALLVQYRRAQVARDFECEPANSCKVSAGAGPAAAARKRQFGAGNPAFGAAP